MDIVVDIIEITARQVTPPAVEALAWCLAASQPDRTVDHKRFWEEWFSEDIPGSKLTVAAILRKPENVSHSVVGVCRLWKTPYLDGRWFIEGLEVMPGMRRRGIGTRLVRRCVDAALGLGIAKLHAHIHDSNLASRRLFEYLGFVETAHGYWNTYGEWRESGSEYALDLNTLR
ncbi:MAG: GNAT family N-acetyltransferase [Bacillota bacterium]|nr:GNAT family N-acetyltransferase [Candidatus Fermentithermobacillaceae bacterium]